MKPRTFVALVLFVVAFWAWVVMSVSAQPEGAMGQCQPVEQIVGMSGYDVILIRGTVDAAEHESIEGFFNIGHVGLSVPRQSVMQMHLNDKRGRVVELRLRVVEKPELQRVER